MVSALSLQKELALEIHQKSKLDPVTIIGCNTCGARFMKHKSTCLFLQFISVIQVVVQQAYTFSLDSQTEAAF